MARNFLDLLNFCFTLPHCIILIFIALHLKKVTCLSDFFSNTISNIYIYIYIYIYIDVTECSIICCYSNFLTLLFIFLFFITLLTTESPNTLFSSRSICFIHFLLPICSDSYLNSLRVNVSATVQPGRTHVNSDRIVCVLYCAVHVHVRLI